MSDRSAPRYTLFGVGIIIAVVAMAVLLAGPVQSDNAAKADGSAARPANTLQSLAELDGKAPSRRQLDIQHWTTAEGARVLFVEARELPMFDLRLTFAAGSSQDGSSPGLATLTNAMLNEGVAGKDVTAIAQGFEGLGADFGNGSYRDMAVASLRSLSATDKREPALKLFAEVVGKPTFPADALERIRNQLLAGFEYEKQSPGKIAGKALFANLYGSHPYAHPTDGTAQSISGITLEQVRTFHAKGYTAGNAVIALVGDLSRSEAEAIAAQVSTALPQGPALAAPAAPTAPKAGVTHIDFPTKQTHLMFAQLGITRQDPDWPALSLANQILGGGAFGTRLMAEVREKRGLTYGVYSAFSPMQVRGPFMINLQTRAELSEGTRTLVQGLLADYLKTGPSQQELDDAKRELAGSFPLSNASNMSIVGQLAAIGFYHLPLTWLEDFMQQSQALTVEQVRAALNRHLAADQLVIVTVGPNVPQKPLPPPAEKTAEQPLGVPEH